MAEPLRVLFVCTANICRSPSMELLARHLAARAGGAGLVLGSAGTLARGGHPIDPETAATLPPELDPDDVAAFRSRRLTPELLREADLVLTAEAVHRQHVLDDHPGLHRTVFTLGQFRATIADLPGPTGRELLAAAGQRRAPSSPDQDVADPYRRGTKAAHAATGMISEMLGDVVPRLAGRPEQEQ